MTERWTYSLQRKTKWDNTLNIGVYTTILVQSIGLKIYLSHDVYAIYYVVVFGGCDYLACTDNSK